MNVASPAPYLSEGPMVNKTSHPTPDLVVASQDVLLQGLSLLFKIFDATYSRMVEAPYGASIGGHYRHILEHFQCLARGMRSGEINYDTRERNPRLETEVTYATISTCDVLRAIKNYTEEGLARPCTVVNSVSYGAGEAPIMESNIGRELAYCAGHAIHHYAIIRLICSHLRVEVAKDFGIAPSTLKSRASTVAD
jgi:hypothetical protein